MPTTLELKLLGPLEIRRDGISVTDFKSGKAQALLCYLAVSGRSHPRPALAGLLWGDMPEPKARMNLSQALTSLRRIFGDHLEISRQMIAFNRDSDYWLDVAAFEAGANNASVKASIDSSQQAVDFYRGDFLDGFYVRDAPDFEAWVLAQRAHLRKLALQTLHQLSLHFTDQGQPGRAKAIDYTTRLLALEPWWEEAHRQLMLLLALGGQRSAALAQYETCRQVLAAELGIEPAEETTALYQRIRAGEELARPGYDPAPVEPKSPTFLFSESDVAGTDRPAFVARAHELARLDRYLTSMVANQGRVIFVTGEAGSGKTALVQEFARRAQEQYADLVVAWGNCNAHTGQGDPYLPFRTMLSLLAGDVEAQWQAGAISRDVAERLWYLMPYTGQALVNVGPDLIDSFVPGPALLNRVRSATADHADWLTQLKTLVTDREAQPGRSNLQQKALFEQYFRVLQTLARRQPLLLVIDDLQWADTGSINLLFHLGRQLKSSRILIVGIYRPADVALGRRSTLGTSDGQMERHPLEAVVNEFKREFGQNLIDLSQAEGRPLVEALLDSEPNRLSRAFREALYRHTQGHPLFTVEMLRGLKARGDLVQDEDGYWVEGAPVQWAQLPARVEGIVAERIGRLPDALHETLKVASIMGDEFIAEVVARVLQADEREVVRQLSNVLDKQHHLVQSQGGQRLGGGQRLSQYRFQHILLQSYLYHSIDEAERAYLHEDVGSGLEQLYAGQIEAVAIQLARHFREAGLSAKAVDYLQQAGEQAARRWANQEAVQLFNDALALLKTLPEASERRQQELSLHLALAEVLWNAGQIAEAMNTFQRSADIARALDSPEDLARAALGFEHVRYRFNLPAEPAVRLLEEARLALGEENSVLRVRVLGNLSRALLPTGTQEQLEVLSEQAIEMARRVGDPAALFDTLQISILAHRRPEKIEARIAAIDEMFRLTQETGDQERAMHVYPNRVFGYLEVGDIQTVDTAVESGYLMAEKLQAPFWLHVLGVQKAMRAMLGGDFTAGEKLAQQALKAGQQMQVENVDGTYGIQMFTIQREKGGLRGLTPIIKSFVEQNPEATTWGPGLALIYSDLGLEPEARAQFETLAANDFAGIPQDALWVGSMAYLSEVCAFLGDVARANILYRLLLPYAQLNIVVGFAVACFGAAARYLGLLAATMSHWTEAEQHFEAALEMNARMGARPWLAHTQVQFAAMLLARGQPADRDRANSLLDEALAIAAELEMKFLSEKIETLKR